MRFAGGSALPVEPVVPHATLPLPEGTEIPVGMSPKSWSAFKQRVNLMVVLAEPKDGSEGAEEK